MALKMVSAKVGSVAPDFTLAGSSGQISLPQAQDSPVGGSTPMFKLTWRYVRYALSALATIGFGLEEN
jgi:hypothetical protein